MQRIRVDTAREHLARSGLHGIVGTSQTRDRIEQDHDVVPALDHSFGFLQYHLGDLHMTGRLLVESRRHDLGLHVASHLGHLLRTFVDQQHDQVHLRMIVGNGIGNRLQQHRLAGFGLGYDQTALPFADRREQVDHPTGDIVVPVARQIEFLGREQRSHKLELHTVAHLLRTESVDAVDLDQRKIFLALFRGTDRPLNRIAHFQTEQFDLRRRDINVVRRVQVIIVGRTQKAIAVGHDFEHALSLHNTEKLFLRLFLRTGIRTRDRLRALLRFPDESRSGSGRFLHGGRFGTILRNRARIARFNRRSVRRHRPDRLGTLGESEPVPLLGAAGLPLFRTGGESGNSPLPDDLLGMRVGPDLGNGSFFRRFRRLLFRSRLVRRRILDAFDPDVSLRTTAPPLFLGHIFFSFRNRYFRLCRFRAGRRRVSARG